MPTRHTLGRFILVGVGNTATGLACIYAARAMGLGEVSANAAGYALGFLLSFGLNRHWTFQHRGPPWPHLGRFSVLLLVAWLANLAALLQLLRWGLKPVLAQACAVLPYTMISYLGCRWWVFSRRSSQDLDAGT